MYEYGLLTTVTLLATLLRFFRLGEWSFWIDEIYTVLRAQDNLNYLGAIFSSFAAAIKYWPPVSILLTAGTLKLLGTGEWSARLVPALIGVITIPALYFPIKKLFGPAVALTAVLLLAVSPWHLEWSQNARFYTPLMLLYSLASFALLFVLERDQPWYLLLFFLLLLLAIRERFPALFLVPVVLGYLLLLKILPFDKPPGFRPRNVMLILLPGVAFGLFDSYRFITEGYSYFTASLELAYNQPIDDPLRLATFTVIDIGIPLVVLAVFGGIYLILQKSRTGLFFFLGAIVPVVLLLLANPFVFTKDRYAFVTLPSWAILAAVAVREIFAQAKGYGKLLAIGVLALLVADAAGAILLYYYVNNGNRHDWKGAFALVEQRSREEDIFVTWWPELGSYYLDQTVISWRDIDPDTVVQSGKRAWFVIDSETVWGNQEMKSWVEQNAELIDLLYLRRQDDFSLRIYLYDPEPNKVAGQVSRGGKDVSFYSDSDHRPADAFPGNRERP